MFDNILVVKFGGTSVGTAPSIERTAEIIKEKKCKKIVVVSAFAGVTNEINELCKFLEKQHLKEAIAVLESIKKRHIKIAKELLVDEMILETINSKIDEYHSYIDAIKVLGEISNRTKDLFFSLGEYLSSIIISVFYRKMGLNAVWSNSRDIIKTDSNFTSAKIDYQETEEACSHLMKLHFEENDTIVCGGFYGSDMNNEITTLGRGGSDLSAAVIARCVKAGKLEIYTDVSGIMSADPRIVKEAHTLTDVTYNEASELAISGAKVLHPRTIAPAVEQNIPVFVLNTFDNNSTGTKISNNSPVKKVLKSIAISQSLMIIKLKFTEKENEFNDLVVLTGLMEKYGYSTKAMTLQNNSMTIAIDNIEESQELFFLGGITGDLQIIERVVAISLIGEQINLSKNLFTDFLNTLYSNNIQTVFSTNSDINITFYIPEYKAAEAANLLHKYCQ